MKLTHDRSDDLFKVANVEFAENFNSCIFPSNSRSIFSNHRGLNQFTSPSPVQISCNTYIISYVALHYRVPCEQGLFPSQDSGPRRTLTILASQPLIAFHTMYAPRYCKLGICWIGVEHLQDISYYLSMNKLSFCMSLLWFSPKEDMETSKISVKMQEQVKTQGLPLPFADSNSQT